MTSATTSRLTSLDGLRGVAAVVIVLYQPGSLLLGWLFYRTVERPTRRLAQRMARQFSRTDKTFPAGSLNQQITGPHSGFAGRAIPRSSVKSPS